ncbi:MAG: radical SAM protein [archaeon]
MRFNKVLLITPFFSGERYTAVLTAGTGYIAETLKRENIPLEVIDPNLNPDLKQTLKLIRKTILTFQPDLIALGMMSINYYKDYEVIREIKKYYPDMKILVGGHHSSTFRERIFNETTDVDYAVILEGEETVVELCKGKPLAEIKGLMYKEGGAVKYNGDRAFVKDLDSIPFPTYPGYDLKKYPDLTLHIVTSRGCPYCCTYCPVKTTIGRVFRVRSAKHVVDELEYWYERGIKNFGIVDDNFTLYRDRVFEICDEIEKRGIQANFNLGNGIRADKVDYDMLKRLKAVGFTEIAIGVESANDHVLKSVKKGENLATIEKAVQLACELGFEVGLFFILGSPGETKEDIMNSFKFALKYPVDYAYFYNIIPFPNTELFDYLEKNNLFLAPYQTYLNASSHWNERPAFVTPELGYADRIRMYRLGKKITKKIQIRRIKKRLKKLGPLATLAAHAISNDTLQRILMTNRTTKKIIIKIKNVFWK